MAFQKPTRETAAEIITYCNKTLITDRDYESSTQYPNEWFVSKFRFLDDRLADQLGEAFYQARLVYTLMDALNLTKSKNKGFIKFQIIQYASICEALLNYTIEHYHKEDFKQEFSKKTYSVYPNAVSSSTKIFFDDKPLALCQLKPEPAKISLVSNADKSDFAQRKGIITDDTSKKYKQLYNLRNNAHLLKAASSNYSPKPKEAKDAYELTWKMCDEIELYIQEQKKAVGIPLFVSE